MSLIAFQHVATHARVTLTQSWYQWNKRARNQNWKNGKSALNYFVIFGPILITSETLCQYSVKWRALLCKVVCKSDSRVFFTIQSVGAFRSLQNLTGTKPYHGPFRVKVSELPFTRRFMEKLSTRPEICLFKSEYMWAQALFYFKKTGSSAVLFHCFNNINISTILIVAKQTWSGINCYQLRAWLVMQTGVRNKPGTAKPNHLNLEKPVSWSRTINEKLFIESVEYDFSTISWTYVIITLFQQVIVTTNGVVAIYFTILGV